MLYREIIAVCSEIHTKHINTAVWAERRIVNVRPGLLSFQWTIDSAGHYYNKTHKVSYFLTQDSLALPTT